MRAGHVGQEKTSRRRHPQAAGLDRDPDARAVRREVESRRYADDAGADRRSGPHGRRAGADRHRHDQRGDAQASRLQAAHDRQFRQRRRQYRRHGGACARHHGDQHAESADRRHRRHDHGADSRGAAAADRRRIDPHRGQELAGLVADLDARPSHRRQAPRHHRHGPHRPGRGPPRARLRPADPLSQPPSRGA